MKEQTRSAVCRVRQGEEASIGWCVHGREAVRDKILWEFEEQCVAVGVDPSEACGKRRTAGRPAQFNIHRHVCHVDTKNEPSNKDPKSVVLR